MAAWTFRCYTSPNGTDEIRSAYEGKQRQARAKLLSRLTTLSSLPFEEWTSTWYKDLHGTASGLGEIRFKADNVQQRILGYRSGEKEFVLLFWAIEKGNKFVPSTAPQIALARKNNVLKSKDFARDLWLALE